MRECVHDWPADAQRSAFMRGSIIPPVLFLFCVAADATEAAGAVDVEGLVEAERAAESDGSRVVG